MKIEPSIVEIAPKIRAVFVPDTGRKTSIISVGLLTPREMNLAESLILPKYLCHTSARYPTHIELNKKLEYLCGAMIGSSVATCGESNLTELAVTCISNRYSPDGSDIGSECLELLLGQIFEPDAENGSLDPEKYAMQKRLAVDSIEREINRKRSYALTRMIEIMCGDEVYGISRQEKLDAIERSTPESAYGAWKELLEKATVQFSFIGSFDKEKSTRLIKSCFDKIQRNPTENVTLFVERAEDVTEVTESMDINQSQLVIGYRLGMTNRDDDRFARQLMTDILGGGPYSLLFKNVREKLSLCYFCSASMVREKGLMIIRSGIESGNRQKVLDEIAKQLEILKRGEFTDEEFTASKTAICDSLSGALDTPDSIAAFLLRKIRDSEIMPIEASIERYKSLTREDVIRAANQLTLDTVYMLEGKGDGDGE